ncbi:MAG TPA: aldehyde dehydrogenase family protein [Rectinemataceae bacterium]|nr:aldehyde dehydrogenase family protein [Rectinemataceae bacterium]
MDAQVDSYIDHTRAFFDEKRAFFDAGSTLDPGFRRAMLGKLKLMLARHEEAILEALAADLGKPRFEAYSSELAILYGEIDEALKHLATWMRPERVKTPLVMMPSRSRVYRSPLGVVLIIGPWNYPFQLLLAPLVGAMAAGNCAVLKPSDQSPRCAELLASMVAETYPPDYVSVVRGPGASMGPELLQRYRFDHIFFTGSPGVGRKILELAAPNLSPVTLELGGKSPAIVAADADLDVAARRIVFGKFFNAGQSCVAPDYLIVERSVKDRMVALLRSALLEAYGSDPQASGSYARIINDKRFSALEGLLSQGRILAGGRTDRRARYIEPTLMDDIEPDSPLLHEEIFGPILPILEFDRPEELVTIIRRNRNPLSLYLFTRSRELRRFVRRRIEFGGAAFNNCIAQLASPHLPFGGVGGSGMGSYHGRAGFETFSHRSGILESASRPDFAMRYPPYTSSKLARVAVLLGGRAGIGRLPRK